MRQDVQILAEQSSGVRVAQHVHAGLVDPGAIAFRIDAADGFGGRVQKETDALFPIAQGQFSLGARGPSSQGLNSKRQIARQFREQGDFLVAEGIRLGGIDHEGPKNSGVKDQRDRNAGSIAAF